MTDWVRRRSGAARASTGVPTRFLLARLLDSTIEINWVDNEHSCMDYHLPGYPKRWHEKTNLETLRVMRLRCPRSLDAWERDNLWKNKPPGAYRGVLERARKSNLIAWDTRNAPWT